jgi:very-short-patch-repair endonuclease
MLFIQNSKGEIIMHPEVERFIAMFEQEAIRKGHYRKQLGKYEQIFLEGVWGPAFQFDFSGLRAEYPFKDSKGGDRFVDFVFIQDGMRFIFEIDGFTTHARDISPGDFDDHLLRQNELILSGWFLLRFSANQVERKAEYCQKQILQAIGHWWSLSHSMDSKGAYSWEERKKRISQLALRKKGVLRTKDIEAEFGLVHRTALNWLQRMVKDDLLTPIKPNERVIEYQLKGYK